MPESEAPRAVPIARQDDPLIEVGQLPDERQFVAALLRLDGGWMAVVHYFVAEGDHVESEHSDLIAGGDAPPEEARAALERMLRQLEPYRQDAVSVCPFETELAGHSLGLSPDRDSGGLRLVPNGPVFVPPAEGAAGS